MCIVVYTMHVISQNIDGGAQKVMVGPVPQCNYATDYLISSLRSLVLKCNHFDQQLLLNSEHAIVTTKLASK